MKHKKILTLIFIIILFFIIWVSRPYLIKIQEQIKILKYGEPISVDGLINNEYFSISSNNTNAEKTTEGINQAIKYASNHNIEYIKLEKGEYLINGISNNNFVNETDTEKGIILRSNIELDLNGSKITQITNDKVNYANITIKNVENVKISNGILCGDKDEHNYTNRESTHEWGFGIDVRGSKNVELSNLQIQEMTGDGIFITDSGNNSENIVVKDCKISNCRRQGISIISGINIEIHDCEIYDIAGTAPQSGIDLESCSSHQVIDNIKIFNNKIYNIKSQYDIIVMGITKKAYIYNNELYGNITTNNIKEYIKINNNNIYDGTLALGVSKSFMEQGAIIKKVIVSDNNLINTNIYLLNVENAVIRNNNISDKAIQSFNSNLALYNNSFYNIRKEQFYIGTNESDDIYNVYIANNIYNNTEDINMEQIQENNILINREINDIKQYINEIEGNE